MKRFNKTGLLTSFYLRKDLIVLVSWILAMTLMTVGVAAVYPNVYPHFSNRLAIIDTLRLPSMQAIMGPLQNSSNSISNIFVSELSLWSMLLTAIFAIILANGNTRKQEDTGLLELMQARCIGRFAPLLATFNELALANGLITIIIGLGLSWINLTGSNWWGNWLFASLIGVAGLFFGLLTILFAQIANDSSQNITFNFGIFTLFYVFFIGIMTHKHWQLDWITPFAVVRKLSIYQQNNFSSLSILFVIGLLMFGLAFGVAEIRDEGSGILPNIPGPKHSPFLRNYSMLVIVTQFKSSIIWSLMLFIFGLMYGSVLSSIQSIVKGNPIITKILQTQANQAIYSFIFVISLVFAVIATIPGIITIYHLVTDEKRGLIELIYARPVKRTTLFLSNTLIGIGISIITFSFFEGGLFISQRATLKDPISVTHFSNVTMANILPMIVVMMLAVFLMIWLPKYKKLIWAVLYLIVFLNYFGMLFKIKRWLVDSTLFGLIKRSLVHPLSLSHVYLMVIISLILFVSSLIRYRKLDL